jgi:hypothetical protein
MGRFFGAGGVGSWGLFPRAKPLKSSPIGNATVLHSRQAPPNRKTREFQSLETIVGAGGR